MGRRYFHSTELPNINFRPLTTSESISAAAYDFKNLVKPAIFDPNWLQTGRIIRTSKGVAVNITNHMEIDAQLKKANKIRVGGGYIYLGDNDFGFAEYETFSMGVQDCDTFAQGGLARVLEHTLQKAAENLRVIASPKFYSTGVNVWGFDLVNEPVLRVIGLDSGMGRNDGMLEVGGGWLDGNVGCAFGGLNSSEASAQKT